MSSQPLMKRTLTSSIKKSASTNALPINNNENMTIEPIELVIFANYPISKIVSCSLDNNKFPNEILNIKNKNDLDYLECMITPWDVEEKPIKKINLSSLSSTIAQKYLKLNIENSRQYEKYIKWLLRIRKQNKVKLI
jgi:hypothetical protein